MLKILLALGILFATYSKSQGQVTPPWFDKVQIFQANKGYYINPSPIMSSVKFTGQAWGVSFPTGWDLLTVRSEINAWHSRGRIYSPSTSTMSLYYEGNISVPDSHRLVDVYGNYADHFMGARRYSVCSDFWRDFHIEQIKKSVDLGADGFHFDDPGFTIVMFPHNQQPASFDIATMNAYRDYLKSKYTQNDLKNMYNINDIDDFNYREWILLNGLETTWNQLPFNGLAFEYYSFLNKKTTEFFDKIISSVKQYAEDIYGRSFPISGNAGIGRHAAFPNINFDFIVAEHYPFDDLTPFAYSFIKGFKAIKNCPLAILPEPKKVGLPIKTKNMIKLIIADIYASGGFISFGEKLTEGIAAEGHNAIEIDFDIMNNYCNFILTHNSLFENIDPIVNVGYLYSQSSVDGELEPIEGNSSYDWGNTYYAGQKLLADNNIQYDCIFAPDPRFSIYPSFDLKKLQNYKVLILPHTFKLTDDQVEIILSYIHDGGIVIAWGDIGTNNIDGTLSKRPALLSLQNGDGIKEYGAGKFVYSSLRVGEAYYRDWGIPHDEVRQNFLSSIKPYITPKIITENVSQIYRAGGATGFLFQDKFENHILHLVNYDYNEFDDVFAVKENFNLKILADTTKLWNAVLVSPDFTDQQILQITNDSGYVSMIIPKLEAYSIVILQQNYTAPQILLRTPPCDTTIIAGDSLYFSIQAQDFDQNHLFYQWYSNGNLDSLATDSTYLYRTTRTSSGVDTISVKVSDGKNHVSTKWIVTIRPYYFPKILFDESHGQPNSTLWSRAVQINPEHPEWNSYRGMVEKLEKDYIVLSDTTGPLTLDKLKNIDVLVFSASYDDVIPEERNAILQFADEGGKTLFLGHCGWWCANVVSNGNLYKLLQDFGFKTNLYPIRSLVDTLWSSDVFYLHLIGSHPATFGVERILIEGSHKLETISANTQIIETTGILPIWQDINDNRKRDSNEPLESNIGIVGLYENSKGKVLYMSIDRFTDDRIYGTPNFELLSSVMKFLTEDKNQIVTVRSNEIENIHQIGELNQNYPNPFNMSTVIGFQIPKNTKVSIKIYDILGREVRMLTSDEFSAGCHRIIWNGLDSFGNQISSGLYFYRIETNNFKKTKKLLFLK